MATHNQKLILASNLLIYEHYFRAAASLTERRRQIRFPCGRWNSSCPVTFWKRFRAGLRAERKRWLVLREIRRRKSRVTETAR
jgi:hypothetical protein